MKLKQITKFFILALIVLVFVYSTKDSSYPNTFEITNNTKKIQFDGHHDFSGATMVNLDDDAEAEIFISGHGINNLLLKKIGDKFEPLNIPELLDPNGLTFSVVACDLDHDGRDEILMLNRSNSQNNKSHSRIVKFIKGKWVDLILPDEPLTKILSSGYSASCIDRKGDRRFGLAVSKENGKISYLELVDSKVQDIAETIGIALSSKGRSVLGVPGANGSMNIFVGNEEGANFYFVNKGDGTFEEKALLLGLDDPLFNARGMSLIDLNNDDIPDVVYGNNLGPVRILEQLRDGSFKDVTPELMKNAYAVNSPVVGDFNSDGYEDLYLNNIRGSNKLFSRYKEDWFELDIDVMAEKEMFGISTIGGDLDNDGSYDLLNTHGDGSSFPVTFYSVKPVYNWIKFFVHYPNGGIPRGAVLKLRTTLRDQIRVISSGSGRFANYLDVVQFGLEKNETILFLEVMDTSGEKQAFKEPFKIMETHEIVVK